MFITSNKKNSKKQFKRLFIDSENLQYRINYSPLRWGVHENYGEPSDTVDLNTLSTIIKVLQKSKYKQLPEERPEEEVVEIGGGE